MSTIQDTEAAGAANATAPRVTLASMEAEIMQRFHFTAANAINGAMRDNRCTIMAQYGEFVLDDDSPLGIMTICILVMRNGFVVVGKTAPASPANFNKEIGEKFSYEDCIRQLWPLMGFALREKLWHRDQMDKIAGVTEAEKAARENKEREINEEFLRDMRPSTAAKDSR